MASTGQTDDLGTIFQNLRSKNTDARAKAAEELRRYVITKVSEMSPDAAAKVWDDNINRNLFELMHSQSSVERYGGLLAIDHLLDMPGEEIQTPDSKRHLFRFYNYVRHQLPHHDINFMLAASHTLGRIAKIGGSTFGDMFMAYEVQAAIELLQPDKQPESSSYAGVLILKELAKNSANHFSSHIGAVLGDIVLPLRDARVIVREGAAELLAACLEIVPDRNVHVQKIIQDAQLGLRQSQPEVIHGSLLAYRELLIYGKMDSELIDVGETILRFKAHKDNLVRKTVITLIPTLASYGTAAFIEHFLHKAMGHLLTQLDKPSERHFAFIAIGHTAAAIKGDMKPFLDDIMEHVKQGLQARGKKNIPSNSEEPIFQCLGMLAKAVGPNLTKLLLMNDKQLLSLMFACGLSGALVSALSDIVTSIPPLLPMIQDRLLDMLCMVLSGKPYRPLGAPPLPPLLVNRSRDAHAHGVVAREASMTQANEYNSERITLALTTLGEFDFGGHVLSDLVRICAMPYLESDSPQVRQAAAVTCCRLFVEDPICYQASNRAIETLSDVLEKLLTVGIADPDANIRHVVLSNLHERFDKQLAQAGNIRSLFVALNDEDFRNRVTAVGLIGRLARHNPAYVMPSLRKALIQLLTELEYSTVIATQRLIKPYAPSMLRTLLPKAKDSNATVASNVLTCLGELVCIAAEDASPCVPDLMRVIMDRLSDPSLAKRSDATLHTLGQLCSSTGYVIQPLVDYPQLLPMLLRILRNESTNFAKREVVKVLGILGAIDPFRRKDSKRKFLDEAPPEPGVSSTNATAAATPTAGVAGPLVNLIGGADDGFQTAVISALLGVLKDPSLSAHHHNVVEAIMSIFKTQGLKCATFLPEIIPAFTFVAKNSTVRMQEFHLQQLAILVSIMKEHCRNYAVRLYTLVLQLWDNSLLHLPIVSLVEALGNALDSEFKPFLATIIPMVLKVFDDDLSDKRMATQMKILDAFVTFGTNIEEYLQLVIPVIVRTFERTDASSQLRRKAIQTIESLSARVNFSDHVSRVIHPLVRVLDAGGNDIRQAALDTLCAFIHQLGPDFAIFVSTIRKVMAKHHITHSKYEGLVLKLLNGDHLVREIVTDTARTPEFSAPAEATKLSVNQQHLKQAWDTSYVSTTEDWASWMHHLEVEFMKESPSHALRACMSLVDVYPPLAKELFNAAFFSCWGELYGQYQEDLVRSIELAMTSSTSPTDLIHRLLNLAEFMEHEEKPLPIDPQILGEYAKKCRAYAKALHYRELEFFMESSPAIIESLISINTLLQQHDAAWGTLVTAGEQYDITKHEKWYEKLGRWQEALQVYERKAEASPSARDVAIGRMRCLHALGEWDQLTALVEDHWVNADLEDRRDIAPMAVAAAWSLRDWDAMESYISAMRTDVADKYFYRAILSVHQNQFPKAMAHIGKARDYLKNDISSFIGEDYRQSYNVMVRAQMLSELEEIVTYKQFADQPERQQTIHETWVQRLQGCQPDVEVWQRILQVRTLVITPEDDPVMWIKFANLCRKSGRMVLAEKTINSLLGPSKVCLMIFDEVAIVHRYDLEAPPEVVYAQLKFMWANGRKEESLQFVRHFAIDLAKDIESESGENVHLSTVSETRLEERTRLLARCYLKQGQWQKELNEDWSQRNIVDILYSFQLATHHDPKWYKAWHTWALANFEVIGYTESLANENRLGGTTGVNHNLAAHVVQAVNGFFRSIALHNEDVLQDTLRLLTLWFKYGAHDEVSHAMASGFSAVEVDTWLEVIPQVIARIQTPHINIRRNINALLTDVGQHHPQALVYPLTVASKSSSKSRQLAAAQIMDRMREHSAAIISQALLVSRELIRVAILWHELWHDALEEASRLYFTENNPEGMIMVLEPLHEMIAAGPTTTREISFVQVFGRELHEAQEACRRYHDHGDAGELDKAWAIYYDVFKKIEKQLPQLTSIDLQYVSPALLKSRNLELAVPGTYQSGRPVVKIVSFAPKLGVIASKQRPRKLSLIGSDGKEYNYLLKGHEDLRQDERVMQLLGLVNTLLSVDTDSFQRRLHVKGFSVIPLAPNAGLLGWVHDSDTLHVLVRDYRDTRKVLLNIEYRLMLQMAPDYENLILLQKVEVFEHALSKTTGQDLYRVLWLKSNNSEHWLERRATYTRSLAVNSMFGYILGLGDRHPSNLMLERSSGKVIHCDYGDCFEIAMHREKFPEKVPFRLTRMLTHAMEMQTVDDNMSSMKASPQLESDPEHAAEVARMAAATAVVAALPQGPTRKLKADENDIFNESIGGLDAQEVRNERALAVYNRVQHKLTGRDFNPDIALNALVRQCIMLLIPLPGTNLQALIDAINTPSLPNSSIVLVVSNRKAAYGLIRASQASPPIPTYYIALQPYLKEHPGKGRSDYDREVGRVVLQAHPDVVVLAGWMHVFGDGFLEEMSTGDRGDSIPVINIHPALPGAFDGMHAIDRAYEAFQKGEITKSGVMVHRVVKEVDRGEPILVREVDMQTGESKDAFEERIHRAEWEVIVEATRTVLDSV
ncbi:phosphatidylinositol kinase- protein kinase tor1 [Pleurotus pulmonarius]|nr:phosphatidylinositol kinase- protein kinase tor1 [Pleurotus pulmonarius]